MEAGAAWTLPPASMDINRTLYFYRGQDIRIAGISILPEHSVDLLADLPVILENGAEDAYLLLLQGKPINEPIVQHGPFVMNSIEEIQQAFADYRKTQFGGWPWQQYDHVHPRSRGRFAHYSDGRDEIKS
jgi:redox-sensitive bicupin YhaK (pirin superfamily)